MIPIRTDYRMSRTPWVNYALVGANILVFLLGYNGSKLGSFSPLLLQPESPQLSQFFTSMFLHANFQHLLGNMLFLWVFGNALNDRFGHLSYLAFYLAGGVLAGVGYLLLNGQAPVLGASGAISAVAGAYLVLLPRVRVTVLVILIIYITYFEVSSMVFLLIQFVWNLWMSLKILGNFGGGVAYSAHSVGYIFGITVAVVALRLKLVPRDTLDLLDLLRNFHRRSRFRRMVARGYDPFNPNAGVSKADPPAVYGGGGGGGGGEESSGSAPATQADREMQLRREISQACADHMLGRAASKYLQLVQIAEHAVLPRQQQLDVANHLMASEQHPAAADAYERFLKHYSTYEHLADIYLLLGLLYCRYLDQHDRAERMLERAVELLDDPKKIELARSDLRKIRGHG